MGLSAPKNRNKFSSDPNNTAWSKSTDNYGHRILTAQGWKPGQLLGATDAAHAEHFTAANASHIRVIWREDNLGLGVQRGKSNAETFGLSTLSGIFGRLNGRSDEEAQKMQVAQRDAELRLYQNQKHGFMNFVRGGLLVGDEMKELDELVEVAGSETLPALGSDKKAFVKAKRKRGDETLQTSTIPDEKAKVAIIAAEDSTEIAERSGDALSTDQSKSDANKKLAKALRRDERRARRLKSLNRKAERRKDKVQVVTSSEATANNSDSGLVTAQEPPPTFAGSRHAIRQRYIQQKRMASMDPRALKEILMLKAAAE